MKYKIIFLLSSFVLHAQIAWGMKEEKTTSSLSYDVLCDDCLKTDLTSAVNYKGMWQPFFSIPRGDGTMSPFGYNTAGSTNTPVALYSNASATKFALAIGTKGSKEYSYRRITREENARLVSIFRGTIDPAIRNKKIQKIVDYAVARPEMGLREDLSRVFHILKNDIKPTPFDKWLSPSK